MTQQSGAPVRLTAHQFVICLLAAVARKGFTSFWAPISDPTHITDFAAIAAWDHSQKYYGSEFECDFNLHIDPDSGTASNWQEGLGLCEVDGSIVLTRPIPDPDSPRWYALRYDTLQRFSKRISDNEEPWDILARVFVGVIDEIKPFALTSATMS